MERIPQIDRQEFRRTVGMFATGVTVVTTCHGPTLHGMTANAFASVSLEPLLVLVCVDRDTGMHELLPTTGRFAVTVLGEGQEEVSLWFSSPRRPAGHDQFAGLAWQPAPVSGCPVLSDGIAYLDCRMTDAFPAGDHSIFLGEVVDIGVLDEIRDPLLYFAGRYRRLRAADDDGYGLG